jgi:hypothetical protein
VYVGNGKKGINTKFSLGRLKEREAIWKDIKIGFEETV